MSSHINLKLNAIWRKLRNKEYRGSFVASQISNTIAAQIFSLREERGWKQAEVAAKAGMKQSRISDLEDPNYENYETKTLVKLAAAFDVGLVIRFVPFSELAKWSATLSPKDFLPTEFLKDGIVPEIEDEAALAKPQSNINYIPLTYTDQPAIYHSIELNDKFMQIREGRQKWHPWEAFAMRDEVGRDPPFSTTKPLARIEYRP